MSPLLFHIFLHILSYISPERVSWLVSVPQILVPLDVSTLPLPVPFAWSTSSSTCYASCLQNISLPQQVLNRYPLLLWFLPFHAMFTFTLSLFYGNSSIPSRATFGCLKNSLTLITQLWLSPTNVSPLLSCQLVISTFLHLSPYPSPYPKPLSLLFILSRYQTFFSYLLSPGEHLVPVSHAHCFIMVIHSYCFCFLMSIFSLI